jgi:ubiquinone/menaquinone biosynthesis C-methylase UbiE
MLNLKKARFKICLSDKAFDAALTIRVVHHLPDLQKAIKEIHRILKPNGFFIIEFPNKIHGKSVIKAILGRKLNYLLSHVPQDISSQKGVSFINYHPNHVKSLLISGQFRVIKILSVSNFRNPIFKKLIPLPILLFLESMLQPWLARLNFGPSIFILAQKSP